MFREKKVAKCANCLPDVAGAIFRADYKDSAPVWKCCNCHHTTPRRTNKPTKKITPSQQRILDKLTSMGWRITKCEFREYGRGIWIEAECDNSWVMGNRTYGSIEVRGAFKLHTTGLGSVKEVTDDIGISVYLAVYKK